MAHKPKDVYTNVKIEIMCASVRNFRWAIRSETNMPPKINKQTPQMNLAGDIFPAAACKMAFVLLVDLLQWHCRSVGRCGDPTSMYCTGFYPTRLKASDSFPTRKLCRIIDS